MAGLDEEAASVPVDDEVAAEAPVPTRSRSDLVAVEQLERLVGLRAWASYLTWGPTTNGPRHGENAYKFLSPDPM